jgi:hypothetical protein
MCLRSAATLPTSLKRIMGDSGVSPSIPIPTYQRAREGKEKKDIPAESYPRYSSLARPLHKTSQTYLRSFSTRKEQYPKIPKGVSASNLAFGSGGRRGYIPHILD